MDKEIFSAMIFRIINTQTDDIIAEQSFNEEQALVERPMWETQCQLYALNNPPITARLEIEEE